jgi:hypothetical protein
VRADLEDAAHVLRARSAFLDAPGCAPLARALDDLLGLLQQRLLACLSIRYGSEGVSRVAFQLSQGDSRSHALALEWVDVILTGLDRAVLGLLEPGWTPDARLRSVSRWFPLPELGAGEILREIAEDPDHRWRQPWLVACALLAASHTGQPDLAALDLRRRLSDGHWSGDEGSIVEETLVGLRRRQAVRVPPSCPT